MRWLVSLSLFVVASHAFAQPVIEPGPKSPEDSLKCIQVRPGFKVELMAAEPLVQDPIAFAWGPDGKFWVVEMGDYPLGVDGKNKPGGKVKFLTKSKEDGPYDKATLFLDNLGYPTGVFPYGKGVLVTCAPDIFYAEDTDGDGKADKKEVLYTGFREGNQQHRVNGLVWGLDNWIYGANGDSGGVVKSLKTGQSVDIRGRDFRIRPWTGEIETQTGQTQFGRARDDWGNWFGNNNTHPLYHYVLDDHYLRRNPHVLYPDPRVEVSVQPGAAPVYPISKPLPRFNSPQALNHFTSACSAILYRDDFFGPEFVGNSFVSEPVHNLIHREIVKPKGVTFTSQRAPDEQTSEFLASSDNWFRPTMIQVGPDGALWIADMYRYVIEHPEWIPKDWQQKLDLRAGHDKGRIYRVYPADKKPRAILRIDKMETKELVECLENPGGWTRDMAQQRLVSIKDRVAILAWMNELHQFYVKTKSPLAQVHALWCMEEFTQAAADAFFAADIAAGLKSQHPGVRRHAVRIAEGSARTARNIVSGALVQDEDPQVQLQLAYSLGSVLCGAGSDEGLATLLCREKDHHIRAAALSSIGRDNWSGVYKHLHGQNAPAPVLAAVLPIARAYGGPEQVTALIIAQLAMQQDPATSKQFSQLAELLDSLERAKTRLAELLRADADPSAERALAQVMQVHSAAQAQASDPKAPLAERINAARLLNRGLDEGKADLKTLAALLTPQTPDDLQTVAIQSLGRGNDPRVPGLLLKAWPSYSPALRGQALDALLNNLLWTRQLVEALEKHQLPASEIDAIRRQRLLQHRDESIRNQAARLFAAASDSNRNAVVNDYWLKLPDKADTGRGAKLYVKACAVCHKLGEVGQAVGPDLAAVGDKTPQGLLTAILDPNRAVEARYVNYLATTKGGLTLSGMLQSETSTSITLVSSDGKSHQLLRNELDELVSTGKSLMPEGLEKDLSPQDLADIIAYVRGGGQATPTIGAPR